MKKKYLLIGLMIMAVGFATVTTTLLINGSSMISSNDADFKVYYSNALVNGTQNLRVVVDETHLSFTTTLDTIGQSYVLDYDVTNGSKNYDADVEMVCTGGNDYLRVTNEFDDESKLIARQTRSGKLTLEMIKSNVGDDIDVNIECTIRANAVERNSKVESEVPSPVSPFKNYRIGEEVILDYYPYNVISQTDTDVTLLSKHVLNAGGYITTTNPAYIHYEQQTLSTWTAKTEIELGYYGRKTIYSYLDKYKTNFSSYFGVPYSDLTADLITVDQLISLGCTAPESYEYVEDESLRTCESSPYKEWLIIDHSWWTKSGVTNASRAWGVTSTGVLNQYFGSYTLGVRPVITVPKKVVDYYTEDKSYMGAQAFCESKGYEYGIDIEEALEYDALSFMDDGYTSFVCANDSFECSVYGYDPYGLNTNTKIGC